MRIRHLAPAFALGLAVLAGPPSARAQGYGWGWGWGGGIAMPWVPSPTNTVNAFALQNAARAGAPQSNNVYAHNPNSYMYRLRDNGLVQQQNARGPAAGSRAAASLARRSPGEAPTSAPSPGAARPDPNPADAQPARTAPAPLASFFDAAGALIWPADSPYEGTLKEKRDTSDRAVAAVRSEVDARGVAPIPLAAEARQKLLDYGRPALQEIRATSTPRVSETFHEFLLGLYDSIAAATIPPAPSE